MSFIDTEHVQHFEQIPTALAVQVLVKQWPVFFLAGRRSGI